MVGVNGLDDELEVSLDIKRTSPIMKMKSAWTLRTRLRRWEIPCEEGMRWS
jgi:hypothetical protein